MKSTALVLSIVGIVMTAIPSIFMIWQGRRLPVIDYMKAWLRIFLHILPSRERDVEASTTSATEILSHRGLERRVPDIFEGIELQAIENSQAAWREESEFRLRIAQLEPVLRGV
ncbi:MAG: hypothetical protein M1834_001927 [Cirrosporium novae-zelandiae]|nr:MAG: hypothetical protein M1834_001927 [Cirrosporium novae-zelandiae]